MDTFLSAKRASTTSFISGNAYMSVDDSDDHPIVPNNFMSNQFQSSSPLFEEAETSVPEGRLEG